MQNIANLLARCGAADFLVRPLLYVCGGAATAAGVYYYVRNRGDEERTTEHSHTTLIQDPDEVSGDDSSPGPDLLCDVDGVTVTPTGSAAPAEDSLAEAERKYEQVMQSNAQLEKEKCDLMSWLNSLQGTVVTLFNEVYHTDKDRDVLTRDLLAEAKKNYMTFMQLTADLKSENAELSSIIRAEERRMNIISRQLADKKSEYEGKEQELRDLWSEYNETKETLLKEVKKRESLSASLSNTILQDCDKEYQDDMNLKAKYDEMKQHYVELLKEKNGEDVRNSDTLEEANEKQARRNRLKEELAEATREVREQESRLESLSNSILQKCEGEPEVHRVLLFQNVELKKLLNQKEELLKVSLDEAEENYQDMKKKYEETVRISVQLEKENSYLMSDLDTMKDLLHNLEETLTEAQTSCEETTRDYEEEREAHRILKSQYDQMMEMFGNEWKVESEQEAHIILKTQYQEMMETLKLCHELLHNLGSRQPAVP